MDTILFDTYTVRHLLYLLGGVVVLYLGVSALKKALGGNKTPKHMQQVSCAQCGWKGQVSRYNARCPKCNNAQLTPLKK